MKDNSDPCFMLWQASQGKYIPRSSWVQPAEFIPGITSKKKEFIKETIPQLKLEDVKSSIIHPLRRT